MVWLDEVHSLWNDMEDVEFHAANMRRCIFEVDLLRNKVIVEFHSCMPLYVFILHRKIGILFSRSWTKVQIEALKKGTVISTTEWFSEFWGGCSSIISGLWACRLLVFIFDQRPEGWKWTQLDSTPPEKYVYNTCKFSHMLINTYIVYTFRRVFLDLQMCEYITSSE